MATRGFEFAYMLDGSNATPVIQDFILSTAAAHKKGDLMVLCTDNDGPLTQAAATATEVTAVCQEDVAAADITADTTKAKMAIITRNQVWRCSMDAATTALVNGYTKTVDIVDCNTIDADGSSGKAILVDASTLDDAGNVLAYVVFSDTTFGNT
jgi:hypothetical protein